ncbi:MAG: UDP-3-O-acyl-N-acetylglucosamine deacetylase [Phycisphaerales bacterium]
MESPTLNTHTLQSQRTLARAAMVDGVGLFTGKDCRCTIHPADANHGIMFSIDTVSIPVGASAISERPVHAAFAHMPARCSALESGASTVWLVEHVLSALAGLGITNARIELDHSEVPIGDGSALPFVDAIQSAGTVAQVAPLNAIKLDETVRVEDGDSWIQAQPTDRSQSSYAYTIDYGDDSPIKQTTVRWDGDADEYTRRIAPARTFCLEHEAVVLKNAGLFAHLDIGQMLVLGADGPMGTALRDPDECGLHKLLDLIGDVALVGECVIAEYTAHKSGHRLAHKLAIEIQRKLTRFTSE